MLIANSKASPSVRNQGRKHALSTVPASEQRRVRSSVKNAGRGSITACPQCGQAVSPTAKFCAECGTSLMGDFRKFQACPEPSRRVSGSKFPAASPSTNSAPRTPNFPTPNFLHAQTPGRENSAIEVRPRRRTQAGDGAVRRCERVDGAGRAARPRGVASDSRSLLCDSH